MNTIEIIAKADRLYDEACNRGPVSMAEYVPEEQRWIKEFKVKELWYLWGLCCNINGRAWDDEVYNALDALGEFKH